MQGVYLKLCLVVAILSTSNVCCQGDVCEEHDLPNGNHQRSFGCPRLDDENDEIYCCGEWNSSSHVYCCNNATLSVYGNEAEVDTKSVGNFIGKIVVLIYGLVVVLIVVVDAISHFFVKKKKQELIK